MNLEQLIKEYKEQSRICANTDYSSVDSVQSHNNAVDRMDEIASTVHSQFGLEGLTRFSSLLDISDNETNVWVAVHMLEKMNLDPQTKEKALSVIEKVANEDTARGLGIRYWLKDYRE